MGEWSQSLHLWVGGNRGIGWRQVEPYRNYYPCLIFQTVLMSLTQAYSGRRIEYLDTEVFPYMSYTVINFQDHVSVFYAVSISFCTTNSMPSCQYERNICHKKMAWVFKDHPPPSHNAAAIFVRLCHSVSYLDSELQWTLESMCSHLIPACPLMQHATVTLLCWIMSINAAYPHTAQSAL